MLSRTGPYRSSQAPPRRAFTLIELMLVMTIVTAVIAVAAPSLANFFRGRTLDSEARRLLALTRHGQSRAVSEGLPMELWVDAAQGTFGLEAETSYTSSDAKALGFTLDKDIQVEVINVDPAKTANAANTASRRMTRNLISSASQPLVVSKHPNLPMIRFLPDGSISETSPQVLHLLDRDGASLWLTLSRDLVNYEIRTQNK
jgi:type II secretion system protein H